MNPKHFRLRRRHRRWTWHMWQTIALNSNSFIRFSFIRPSATDEYPIRACMCLHLYIYWHLYSFFCLLLLPSIPHVPSVSSSSSRMCGIAWATFPSSCSKKSFGFWARFKCVRREWNELYAKKNSKTSKRNSRCRIRIHTQTSAQRNVYLTELIWWTVQQCDNRCVRA